MGIAEQVDVLPGGTRESETTPATSNRSVIVPVTARTTVRQQSLPLPWQLAQVGNSFDEGNFSHPAEIALSRILNFYRVRWSYEPTTFALSYTADGLPSEMFTPDFYLPELKMYIEVTTMRQRLVTRKNRKMRRLREIYPEIQIKLLYRRDCERLGDAYAELTAISDQCREGRILFTEEQIRHRVAALAGEIETADRAMPAKARSRAQMQCDAQLQVSRSLPIWQSALEPTEPTGSAVQTVEAPDADDRLIVMSVDPGSRTFAAHLASALEERGYPIACDRVRLSRHRAPNGKRRVKIANRPKQSFAGRRILLVADVVSTGLSHAYLTSWLLGRGAAHVEICTLLNRQSARLVEVPVRYAAFDAPNDLLVGFGLHLRQQFQHLPYIATLVTDPVEPAAP